MILGKYSTKQLELYYRPEKAIYVCIGQHKLPAEIALDLGIMVVIFQYGFNENARRIYQNVRKTHKREVSV